MLNINNEPSKVIDNFLSNKKPRFLSDLRLSQKNFYGKKQDIKLPVDKPIDDLVLWALNSTVNRSTLYLSGRIQCERMRRRSALDLWRILKFYFPHIKLHDVMGALFKLVENKRVNTSYCSVVSKRVFYRENISNYSETHHRDEFGLRFSEWGSFTQQPKLEPVMEASQ